MAVKELAPLKPTPNAMILDFIRNKGSNEYQRRIPSATKAGVQDTLKALNEFRVLKNEFIDAFVNQIGLRVARHTSWTNPLAEFKLGMLTNGTTIQESQVGLLKAHNFDPDREQMEQALFGTERPEVQVNYHTVNRRNRYDVSVSEDMLRGAFVDDMGLYEFVNQLMAAPTTSDQLDEFIITCNLFNEYESNGGFFKVNVPDVAANGSTDRDAKTALRRLREMADEMTFLNENFNVANMPTFANRDDLVIFTTPQFKSGIDVEALASSFNMEHSKMHGRIIPIPQKQLKIPGAQAIMTTSDFFMIADSLYETTQMYNPAALSNKHFLHHHQVVSASRFVPAVLFTTHAGDEIITISTPVTEVKDVTVTKGSDGTTATELVRGEIYQYGATVVTEGPNDGLRWSLTGNTSTATYITQTGVLHVGGQEGAAKLTVTATSTWLDDENLQRDGKSASKELPVTGEAIPVWREGSVTDILIKGVPVPGFDPNVYTYSAVPVEGGKVTVKDIKVSGPDAGDVKITINADGTEAVIEAATAPGDPVYTITVVAA